MLLLYCIFFLVWLCSVAYRAVSNIVTFGYFPDVARAYWGLRYFNEHLVIEAIVVVALGIAVGLTVQSANNRKQFVASVFGFFALPLMILFHFATLKWEIGYQERVLIAGETHVVDWKYSPYVTGKKQEERTLHVDVVWPSMKAIYDTRPETYVRLSLAKSDRSDSAYSSIFATDSDAPNESECVEEPYNRYCRVFSEGAWYYAHHQNVDEDQSHLFPQLSELEREIPKLFDSFVEQY